MMTASLAVSLPRLAFADPALQAIQLQNWDENSFGVVRVGYSPALQTQCVTLQVVIRPEGNGYGQASDEWGCHVVTHAVEGEGQYYGGGYAIRWSPTTTRVNFQLAHALDYWGVILFSNTLVPVGTTAQVSATFDGVTARLYVNGVLDNEAPTTGSWIAWDPDTNLRFGAGNGPSGYLRRFQGIIDNVRLWDRALSAAEIACNMADEPSGPIDGLIGAWTFNNGSYADVSGHGRDAVAEGHVTLTDQPIVSPPPRAIVDFNHDCQVDGDDLAIFNACATGPAVAYNPALLPAECKVSANGDGHIPPDLDHDDDVDQSDFGIFQRCYSDEGNPADPNCAD